MPVTLTKHRNLSESMSWPTIGQWFDRYTNWLIGFCMFLFSLSIMFIQPAHLGKAKDEVG